MNDSKTTVEGLYHDNTTCNIDEVVVCEPTPRKKRKKRGPTVKYTKDQLTLLESVYSETTYPTKAHIQYLTRRTQLPPTIVRRWFYQRRSREDFGTSSERIHLIPQSVLQADVSADAPNYKRFKTVLVKIQSPTRSSTTNTRSFPNRSSASWPDITRTPFGDNHERFGQSFSQTPTKANFGSPGFNVYPYEDTFLTSTPKSGIETSESGYISFRNGSNSTGNPDSPLSYDEPISSIGDIAGYYQSLEANSQTDFLEYRRDAPSQEQSWSSSQSNLSGFQKVHNSNSEVRDANANFNGRTNDPEIIRNSMCGPDTSYNHGAFESSGGSVYESEPRTSPSTPEDLILNVPSPQSDSEVVASKPHQTGIKDPVTILQYINYEDLKKLGIGPNIDYDAIPTLKTGEANLMGDLAAEKDPEDPCVGSPEVTAAGVSYYQPIPAMNQGELRTQFRNYGEKHTQTYPDNDPYVSEPLQDNLHPHNMVTEPRRASRGSSTSVSNDNFTTYGDQKGPASIHGRNDICRDLNRSASRTSAYCNDVSSEMQQSLPDDPRTPQIGLNRAGSAKKNSLQYPMKFNSNLKPYSQIQPQIVTLPPLPEKTNGLERGRSSLKTNLRSCSIYPKAPISSNLHPSDLQKNPSHDPYSRTNMFREPPNYNSLHDKARYVSSVRSIQKAKTPEIVVYHPPSDRVYQTMDGKSHNYRDTISQNRPLLNKDGVNNKTKIFRPPKTLPVGNRIGLEHRNPTMLQNNCPTYPTYSHSCDHDDNDPTLSSTDNYDIVHPVDSSFPQIVGETVRRQSTGQCRPQASNPKNCQNIRRAGTVQPKSTTSPNVVKVVHLKKLPSAATETNRRQQDVNSPKVCVLNSSLNDNVLNEASLYGKKWTCADDSRIRKSTGHCCCCHRSNRHAQQRSQMSGTPQIYILPIQIPTLGPTTSGQNVDGMMS